MGFVWLLEFLNHILSFLHSDAKNDITSRVTFLLYVQGAFFYCSALKMTKCQPDREISELFLPKKRLRMKKIKVPELFRSVPLPKMTKEKVQVTQLLW